MHSVEKEGAQSMPRSWRPSTGSLQDSGRWWIVSMRRKGGRHNSVQACLMGRIMRKKKEVIEKL